MSDDFLARWSRRKSDARQAESASVEKAAQEAQCDSRPEIEEDAPGPLSAADEAPETPPQITAEEIAALPPVEDLTSASDLTPFLRSGVPMLLRNAALRRMWTVDPGIRDFLNDAREYAYDWNAPGGVPGLGPISSTDDVKAMVRRIFNDPPDRSPACEHEAVASEADVPAGAERPPAVENQDPVAVQAAAPRQEAIPVARSTAESDEEDAERAAVAARLEPPPQTATASGPPRVRRHGGATPF